MTLNKNKSNPSREELGATREAMNGSKLEKESRTCRPKNMILNENKPEQGKPVGWMTCSYHCLNDGLSPDFQKPLDTFIVI